MHIAGFSLTKHAIEASYHFVEWIETVFAHSTMENGDFQVRVRFVTDFDEYRIEDTPFALPAPLNRAGLSNVINHLLSLTDDDTVRFDF